MVSGADVVPAAVVSVLVLSLPHAPTDAEMARRRSIDVIFLWEYFMFFSSMFL